MSSNLDESAERLFAQHEEQAENVVHDVLRDVFHAAGALASEQLELARYEALAVLAGTLELPEARRLLDENRGQDESALRKVARTLERLGGELG